MQKTDPSAANHFEIKPAGKVLRRSQRVRPAGPSIKPRTPKGQRVARGAAPSLFHRLPLGN